jgi:predicted ATPase with chaperone activity
MARPQNSIYLPDEQQAAESIHGSIGSFQNSRIMKKTSPTSGGQEMAKRAVTIATNGGHNLLIL